MSLTSSRLRCGNELGLGTASLVAPARDLRVGRYAPRRGTWIREGESGGGDEPLPGTDVLRLVDWNIWFGQHRWRERLDGLLATIEHWHPMLVGLQDVTPQQLARILEAPWVRNSFVTSDTDGRTLEPHGVLLLSRLPLRNIQLVSLPTRRQRKLIAADLFLAHGPLRVVVTHLESGTDQVGLREIQLHIVKQALLGPEAGLIMGDFNFNPDQDREEHWLGPDTIDCWRDIQGGATGYTLDGIANAMRGWLSGSDRRVRSDRILLRSGERNGSRQWRPADIRRIGLEAIDGGEGCLYPSDHFGLVADIVAERNASTAGQSS
jgi:endonuclease/exonuclease/phosphatase family metal-dependent hydrolase